LETQKITLPVDGASRWAGMANYVLTSPNGHYEVVLPYAGEPPHGDSYHELLIDGVKLPGLVWGCNFAFSADSRFLAASWMAERYERRTIVVDVQQRRYAVLPDYLLDFEFRWPVLVGVGATAPLSYAFDGREIWVAF
jgi:hypothetical protein